MRRGLGLALTALLVVAGACNGDDDGDDGVGPTIPTATTSTTAADEFAVPATIDAAYVERVLAELDRIDGDATRIIVERGDLVRDAADLLAAVYLTDELNAQLELWQDEISDGLEEFRRPPGDVVTDVSGLVRAEQTCVVAQVQRDFRAVSTTAGEPRVSYITLKPRSASQDPKAINATPWMIAAAIVGQEGAAGKCD